LLQPLDTSAQTFRRSRPEILDIDVRFTHQPVEECPARWSARSRLKSPSCDCPVARSSCAPSFFRIAKHSSQHETSVDSDSPRGQVNGTAANAAQVVFRFANDRYHPQHGPHRYRA
jgi:hypothetical protein